MARIVVVGAGIIGLSTALLLAGAGFDVTVLEREAEPPPAAPEAAWQGWARKGVAQFRQPHFLQPGGFGILDTRLPGAADALRKAGSAFNHLSMMPDTITDRTPREGDERFNCVAARRPVLEHAIAEFAAQRLDIRRGAGVIGLLSGPSATPGVPHVTGVRTSTGEDLPADLVIDATGRRSALPGWLADLSARPLDEERESASFTYYTRYFRSVGGEGPVFPGGRMAQHYDCYSLLTLPGDADTWGLTVYVSAHDRPMKELRHVDKWTALVRACRLHEPTIAGEPLTEVVAMSGVTARRRIDVLNGKPVVTGVLSVGDSLCSTNPATGRGISLGLMQAADLTDAVSEHLDAPAELARQYDEMIRARVLPWYRDTVSTDRARLAQVDAVIQGIDPMTGAVRDGGAPGGDAKAAARRAFLRAAFHDPEVYRGFNDLVSVLTPVDEILARPGMAGRIAAANESREPFRAPGPTRPELLELLA